MLLSNDKKDNVKGLSDKNEQIYKARGKTVSKLINFSSREIKAPIGLARRRIAFTLAEVLIVFGIIGVVSVMTLVSVVQDINDFVLKERAKNIRYKFTQATDKMKSLALIGPYDSTDDFVNELEKHFKIMKRCDSTKIRDCWPYKSVVIDNSGKTFDISKATAGRHLKMKTDSTHKYGSTVSIITADGAPMIISYNQKCEQLEQYRTYAWDKELLTNETAKCAAVLFDANGAKGPNKLGKDVINFNSNGLGTGCAYEVGNSCFNRLLSYAGAVSCATCIALKSEHPEYGVRYCCPNDGYYGSDSDRWLGAVVQCGGVSNLPTMYELGQIYTNYGRDHIAYGVWSSQEIDSLWVKVYRFPGQPRGGNEFRTDNFGVICRVQEE